MYPHCHPAPHAPLPSLPSPCLTSAILIPLATWLYLLTLGILTPLIFLRHRRSAAPLLAKPATPDSPAARSDTNANAPRAHRKLLRGLSVVYILLLIAETAMFALEIARLVAAGLGVGLLPFNFVGVLCAGAVRFVSGRRSGGGSQWRVLRWVSVGWWVVLGVMYAVGTAVEAKGKLGDGKVGREEYPSDDQVTDRATIAGVAFVLAGLEGVGVVMGGWRG